MIEHSDLKETFGAIDVYLFDQLLKGRFDGRNVVLDAGCGSGRNLVYLLRNGVDVHGVDSSERAVLLCRELASKLAPSLPPSNFAVADLDGLPFSAGTFDAIICNAVLHFAEGPEHFNRMLDELWRVLTPGGMLFVRLASTIGIESRVKPLGDDRYLLPDGSERFLVNEQTLLDATDRLNGTLLDPIKTTNVQNLRCMTTWVVGKPGT
jgi:tellurite methyltransferase